MPRRETPPMADAVAEYQETRELKVSPATHRNKGSLLRAFARAMGERKQVHTITQRQVELWFAAEAKRQKPSSYNKVRTRVKGFIDFARRRGWVTVDLLGKVGTLKVVREQRLYLSPAELLDLPNHATNDRDRAFITLACNTALRANELCSLRVRDVDLASLVELGRDRHPVFQTALRDVGVEPSAGLRIWLRQYEEGHRGHLGQRQRGPRLVEPGG